MIDDWCLVIGDWWLVIDERCLMIDSFDDWCPAINDWGLMMGARRQMRNGRCLIIDTSCLMRHNWPLMIDDWCSMFGASWLMFDDWSLTHDDWCLMPDACQLVLEGWCSVMMIAPFFRPALPNDKTLTRPSICSISLKQNLNTVGHYVL